MKTKATAITTAASFADIWVNIRQLIADETGLLHNYRFFTGAKKYRKRIIGSAAAENGDLNPDNPLGREMKAREVARQFCRLGEWSMDAEQAAKMAAN